MEKAQPIDARKSSGAKRMSSVAITTHSINAGFAELLRPFSAKEVARRLKLPSTRTVENWKEGRTTPQGRHVVAMLTDDELCTRLLELAERGDLAKSADTIAKLRAALGAVEGK